MNKTMKMKKGHIVFANPRSFDFEGNTNTDLSDRTHNLTFPSVSDRQRKLLPLDGQSLNCQTNTNTSRASVVPAISTNSSTCNASRRTNVHSAASSSGRSHSHTGFNSPNSRSQKAFHGPPINDSSNASMSKVNHRVRRSFTSNGFTGMSRKSHKKKTKKSEDKCHVEYRGYGSTTDKNKGPRSITGLSLEPNPYILFNKDLNHPLKTVEHSPGWLVAATDRLRNRLRSNATKVNNQKQPPLSNSASETSEIDDNVNKSTRVSGDSCSRKDSDVQLSDTSGKSSRDGDAYYWGSDVSSGQITPSTADEMDEDDEEEGGLPQAVLGMSATEVVNLSHREVSRERQRARMEEIARTVSPELLTQHLKTCGFFNHQYTAHNRTGTGNHNLKNGKKKQTARLLMLLSNQSSYFT